MTISEVIAQLEAIMDEHGNLYVESGDGHLVQTVEPLRREGDDDGEVIAVKVC